jgi:uncharacterized protein (DUF2147 family)
MALWVMAAAAALTVVCGPAQATAAAAGQEIGTWINPRGSVKVQTGRCGDKLCGWVIWASQEAAADAAAGGVRQIVGTILLRDYISTRPGNWEGEVFVPDMGHTYYSTISQPDANSLKIRGCVLGGLICKSQVWHRA